MHSLPSSLENYINLETLSLDGNNIGMEGCISIAKLLQKDGARLKTLDLESNNMGEAEVEILANSLKCNTSLKDLYLGGNELKE